MVRTMRGARTELDAQAEPAAPSPGDDTHQRMVEKVGQWMLCGHLRLSSRRRLRRTAALVLPPERASAEPSPNAIRSTHTIRRVTPSSYPRHVPAAPIQDMSDARSPTIERLEWGTVHTEIGDFRDAKLWPGGGRDWDWNETGTHHSPGVQSTDVTELLDHDSRVVIIGRGQAEQLRVTSDALDEIAERGAEAEVLESRQAVSRYNDLVGEGVAVGALIHSTC